MTEAEKCAPSPIHSGQQWLVFGPDWGRHPSVSQHLFSQFVGSDPVLWVETVGLRVPRLTWQDLCRCAQKLWDFCSGRRELSSTSLPGLTLLSPTTLPFTQFHLVRRFNLWQVRKRVLQMTRQLGFQNPILVVTVPSQCDYVTRLGEAASLYYCIDDYALWAGMNSRHVRSLESHLLSVVDAVVVASQSLADRLATFSKPVHLLSHGVDVPHFQDTCLRTPSDSQAFEIVYFGLIDERLDLGLLESLATTLPTACIRLIGPVTIPVDALKGVHNIIFEGAVDYQHLPAAVATADLFILPFNQGDLAMSCNPIKLKEYLACGRPVIAMALPEIRPLADIVHVAETASSFLALALAASERKLPENREKVTSYLASESWRKKALQFAAIVERTLSDKLKR
jgi:glycosyltransferase involved in cell wall biosynthesis